MPIHDPFRISQDLYDLLLRFAEDNGQDTADILDRALRDFLARPVAGADTDIQVILAAAGLRIRQTSTLLLSADAPRYALVIKSPLQYVHRPALKYGVELGNSDTAYWGWLTCSLRSHDIWTMRGFAGFLSLWMELEREYFFSRRHLSPRYQVEDTHFARRFCRAQADERMDGEQVGQAIGEYVAGFDTLLKLYINSGGARPKVEREYLRYLQEGRLLV